jgi:chromosome segregation ATPase
MSHPAVLATALKRLSSALDRLEAEAQRRTKADASRNDLVEELAIMQDDRSRLALELDGAQRRIGRLERAHDEAERRLEQAGTTIRAILGDEDGTAPGEPEEQEE